MTFLTTSYYSMFYNPTAETLDHAVINKSQNFDHYYSLLQSRQIIWSHYLVEFYEISTHDTCGRSIHVFRPSSSNRNCSTKQWSTNNRTFEKLDLRTSVFHYILSRIIPVYTNI